MAACIDPGYPGEGERQSEVFGDLEIGFLEAERSVRFRAETIHLSWLEYQIVELLAWRRGSVVTREMFLDHVYGGMDEPNVKILAVVLNTIRRKLSCASNGASFIKSVWGRGYLLHDPDSEGGILSGELNLPVRDRPRVRDHAGLPLTIEDLPRPDARWSARSKARVVWAVRGGFITAEEAAECYRLSPKELESWRALCERHGVWALKTTKVQTLRHR